MGGEHGRKIGGAVSLSVAGPDPGCDETQVARSWTLLYPCGLLGHGSARASSRWQRILGCRATTNCNTSSPARPRTTACSGRSWPRSVDRLVGGSDACFEIDDMALPEKDTRSVGVARQYRGYPGRKASRQALVSLTLARSEVFVPVALCLSLPEGRGVDSERCEGRACPRQPFASWLRRAPAGHDAALSRPYCRGRFRLPSDLKVAR